MQSHFFNQENRASRSSVGQNAQTITIAIVISFMLATTGSLADEGVSRSRPSVDPQASTIDPEAVKNLEAAYPAAPEGMERKVILLPHVDRGDDQHLQVEILVGRIMETDGINSYRLGGAIHERNIQGWGFSYYEVEGDLRNAASTLIGGPTNPAQRFVAGPRLLVRYNSRLPLVVMVPEGSELRWRIWKAADEWTTATDE